MIKIYALRWAPEFAQGLVRDLRARWALEEAGLPYEVKLLSRDDQKSEGYRRLQPFGQVPALEEEGLALFESGAIVLHVAEKSDILLPKDVAGKERARSWVFAAINSIEPPVQNLASIDLFYAKEPWAQLRRPGAEEQVKKRFTELAGWLDKREYLEDRFTVGDLMMTTVLRIPRNTTLLQEFPALDGYVKRCTARPAFQKALANQMKTFKENKPA